MAQLPATGSLSISQIRGLKPSANKSLKTLEQEYMNGNPSNPIGGICMPNDVVQVTDILNNAGVLAQSIGGSPGTTFVNWSYSAPGYTASTPWGPHGAKEFRSAYTGRPSVSLGKTTTGILNNFILTVAINGEFTKNSTNYFVAVNSTVWQGWPGGVTAPGVAASWTSSRSSGTYTVYVKDYLNCGAGGTISAAITYP